MPDFDTSVPHIARIYDYWLGGKDNFAADREAAERAMAATPTIVPGVRANRRFLGRAVRYMAESGIRQFLDIGTGIPTASQVDIATKAEESLTKPMGQKVTFRTREQVSRFFSGLALADPGLVAIQDWRADSALDLSSAPTAMWGGVGRKS